MLEVLGYLSRVEAWVAALAGLLPFGYAFGAGMVASVNPCGFLMLPAFGAYHVGRGAQGMEGAPPLRRILRALLMAGIATAGFVLLFGGAGLFLSITGRGIVSLFPWGGFLVGVALTLVGFWLLVTGHTFGIMEASRVQARLGSGIKDVFLFGMGYAVCSLSCTLPIFLVVVGTALATGGLLYGLTQFVSYGLGMGLVLAMVTVSAALFREALASKLRALTPHVHRVSAVFMLGAGLYIVYYWVVLGRVLG